MFGLDGRDFVCGSNKAHDGAGVPKHIREPRLAQDYELSRRAHSRAS